MDQSSVLRILDVNFNRAAEGLRTLEDVARVVREDFTSAGWCKGLRHALGAIASHLPRAERLSARLVAADAGTALSNAGERTRDDWSQIVTSACERVTQSLRVIEESAKLDWEAVAAEVKTLRYQAYDRLAMIENRLNSATPPAIAPELYLLVDCQIPLTEFGALLDGLLQAGVGLFQLRDKQCDSRTLLEYARVAVSVVGRERIVVNDRVDIALASGAGGVHVGQEDLPIAAVRKIVGNRMQVGVSTHNLPQAKEAEQAGADYIGCGPTFPSGTKRFDQFAGVEFLRQVAAAIDIPAYAIGGIDLHNVNDVVEAGISRIAVSGTILSAADKQSAARELRDRLINRS